MGQLPTGDRSKEQRRASPPVRKAGPETLVVADGTSCRHQIADGAGRQALHAARVLAMSVDRHRTQDGAARTPHAAFDL